MRIGIAAVAVLACATPVAAQHDHGTGMVPGWHGRVDRSDQRVEDVRFMAMGSTFHVITGPHAILWKPENTATGQFTATATFRQSKTPDHPEGYGLIVGGRDLDGPDQDYLYF